MALDGHPQRVNAAWLARLERALLIAARAVAHNPAAIPIFERVDAEITAARAEIEARRINDPIAKARALAMARKAG